MLAENPDYTINVSLVRPNLIAGVERLALGPIVLSVCIGALVGSEGVYEYMALMFAMAGLFYLGARKMAKVDPYMLRVYWRSFRYPRIFAPRSTVHFKAQSRSVEQGKKYALYICGGIVVLGIVAIGLAVAF